LSPLPIAAAEYGREVTTRDVVQGLLADLESGADPASVSEKFEITG